MWKKAFDLTGFSLDGAQDLASAFLPTSRTVP